VTPSDPSASFGAEADLYDRARPSYPREIVDWLVPATARDVVDAGAGTGKLTELLLAPGREVVAVDHDAAMLDRLRERVPAARALVGRGEELPLPDASADAIVYGQAWHWVDVEEASREAGRVLRPGGVLGLVWNLRDDRVPWVAEFARGMRGRDAAGIFESGGPRVAAPFGELERLDVEWTARHTVDSLVELAGTRSYVITASEADRPEILATVRALAERVAAPDGSIELPYVTHGYRVARP